MTKMIVIGAGVMGASVAFRLAQAGADVTVLEATRIGGGTSGISFAWTNAHTSSAPRPGGMAAVVSNGNSNPAGPINGQMSNSCEPGATPPSGSTASRSRNSNPTSVPQSLAT